MILKCLLDARWQTLISFILLTWDKNDDLSEPSETPILNEKRGDCSKTNSV